MADSNPAPAGRQHSEDSQTMRSDIWCDDGNVVLQVENTQFRIHWSVLSRHSSFFRDMRALPQPADQPAVEGCPLINLHDPPMHVQYLLEALYNPLCFSEPSLPLPFIAGIVSLGRKYNFKDLLVAAVGRLTYENPRTLEEYRRLRLHDGSDVLIVKPYTPTKISGSATKEFYLESVKLARDNRLFTVLPALYLRLADIYNHSVDLGHIPDEDEQFYLCGARQIIKAQWAQSELWNWFILDHSAQGCTNPAGCRQKKKALFHSLVANSTFMGYFLRAGNFCNPCAKWQAKLIMKSWETLWEQLPTFFGLPSWNQLDNDL